MDEYIGKAVVVSHVAKMDQDGFWTVIGEIIHKRSKDLAEWESKSTACKVIDKDPDKAVRKVAFTLNKFLETVGGDLFLEDSLKELTDGEAISKQNT